MEQRRGKWNFEHRDDGWGWTVTHADGKNESSSGAFKTLKDCADDAAQHGYVAWKAEDERRRDQMLQVTKALGNKDAAE